MTRERIDIRCSDQELQITAQDTVATIPVPSIKHINIQSKKNKLVVAIIANLIEFLCFDGVLNFKPKIVDTLFIDTEQKHYRFNLDKVSQKQKEGLKQFIKNRND